jgi:hypothetical protein
MTPQFGLRLLRTAHRTVFPGQTGNPFHLKNCLTVNLDFIEITADFLHRKLCLKLKQRNLVHLYPNFNLMHQRYVSKLPLSPLLLKIQLIWRLWFSCKTRGLQRMPRVSLSQNHDSSDCTSFTKQRSFCGLYYI